MFAVDHVDLCLPSRLLKSRRCTGLWFVCYSAEHHMLASFAAQSTSVIWVVVCPIGHSGKW